MKKEYERVEEDAHVLKEDLTEAAREVKNDVKNYLSRLAAAAEVGAQEGSKKLKQRSREVDTMAHEKVWTVAALAAAAGVVLGALISRGRRD